MADFTSLKIVKTGDSFSYFYDGNVKYFSVSKGYVNYDNQTDKMQIVEYGRSVRPNVLMGNVSVQVDGGAVETGFSWTTLENRMIELACPLFIDKVTVDTGGGGTQTYDDVLLEGNETDQTAVHTDGINYAYLSENGLRATNTDTPEKEVIYNKDGVTYKGLTSPNIYEKILSPNTDGSKLQYNSENLATENWVEDKGFALATEVVTAISEAQTECHTYTDNQISALTIKAKSSITLIHTAQTLGDGATYFFGMIPTTPATITSGSRRGASPLTGKIKKILVSTFSASPTSAQDVTLKINNKTTSTTNTIGSIRYDNTSYLYEFDVDISITKYDSLEAELNVPTLTTNGTNSVTSVQILIEEI